MKRILIFILLLMLLRVPAMAAQCGEVVPSDGNGCRECALGDLGADAIRAETGADIALLPAGELGISLLPGPVTDGSLADSFPRDGEIVTTELTPEALRALLEESVSRIVLTREETIDETASAWEGFLCVSGFRFSYDASAPAGERVYELSVDGPVTAAAPAELLSGTAAGTLRSAVAAYCEAEGTVTPPDTDRIFVRGAGENAIVGRRIPKSFVIVVAVVAMIFGGFRYRKRLRTER